MPVSNRGTGLNVQKSEAFGKKYIAPAIDAGLWVGAIEAKPALGLGGLWYEKLGGKETLKAGARKAGSAFGKVEAWWDSRSGMQKAAARGVAKGAAMGAVTGVALGKEHAAGVGEMAAHKQWRAARIEAEDTTMKHLRAAKSLGVRPKGLPAAAVAADMRAEIAALTADQLDDQRTAWGKVGAVGLAASIGVAAYEIGREAVKARKATRDSVNASRY